MRRIIPFLIALSALVVVGCGDAPVRSAGTTASGGSAVGPTDGAIATSPTDGLPVLISDGSVVGPQNPGDIALGEATDAGSGACDPGDFDCLCYLYFDLGMSCGMQLERPLSHYCNRSEYEDLCDGASSSLCWSYFDAMISQCIAGGCACFYDEIDFRDPPRVN